MEDFYTHRNAEISKIRDGIRKQFSNFQFGERILGKMIQTLLDAYTVLLKMIFRYYRDLRRSSMCTSPIQLKAEMDKFML